VTAGGGGTGLRLGSAGCARIGFVHVDLPPKGCPSKHGSRRGVACFDMRLSHRDRITSLSRQPAYGRGGVGVRGHWRPTVSSRLGPLRLPTRAAHHELFPIREGGTLWRGADVCACGSIRQGDSKPGPELRPGAGVTAPNVKYTARGRRARSQSRSSGAWQACSTGGGGETSLQRGETARATARPTRHRRRQQCLSRSTIDGLEMSVRRWGKCRGGGGKG